ncbi:type II toxin-antitoxin system RelE/ParE family toxin [Aquimarina aquimarini]|uniref:type II toxin-antitoxin system RelE/ParE family toxin n=1 Tax=Aquimarina aquimarini TaxID=1191734 RepID=UPI000D5598BA|nr:type II toxin-antitoxin system RelE/ParE family toxin [Aquimarina aquimarini]
MGFVVKPVSWTTRGLKDLKKVSKFNSKTKGREKAIEIAHNIIDAPKILENPKYDFQNIGTVDETFNHLKWEYRKIFCEGCKITYREGKTKIYITRVFDQSQHPRKNK